MNRLYSLLSVLGLMLLALACGTPEESPAPTPSPQPEKPEKPIDIPSFNEDSAYSFIEKQVSFGPRVPNSQAHKNCGNYLVQKLENYGAKVLQQTGQVTAFNGAKLNIRNIIAQFSPEKEKRVMLFAHWDTRPFADRDNTQQGKPIDGANDGGSGVGVLLEIARLIKQQPTTVGIDIIFFDAEDYGAISNSFNFNQMADDWCLGAQYWANNPPIANYKPKYGILLDMVGAEDATFPKEYLSLYFAPNVVNKVWSKAQELGYGNYFTNQEIPNPGITDDHRYVNILAKIPAIDIIHYDMNTMDFGNFHHTHQDNMDIIHKPTLKAVGQTVTEVIYLEK